MSYPGAWNLTYFEVQGLVHLAYKGNGSKGCRYKLKKSVGEKSKWHVVDVIKQDSFRAIVAVRQGDRLKVLSFSGTNGGDYGDWVDNVGQGLTGVSPQYAIALRCAKAQSPDVVVGHSLGGGLASYVGLYQGKKAATINPAPLNMNLFTHVALLRNGGMVVNYVVPGEVLHLLDIAAGNRMNTVGRVIYVRSSGGDPIKRHLLDWLDGFEEPQEYKVEETKLDPKPPAGFPGQKPQARTATFSRHSR
jgi:hypothetical protein